MPKDDVNMEWDFSNIEDILKQMGEDVIKIQSKTTKKIADKVKQAVIEELPKSNSKYEKEDYIHMKDDVKVTSLKEDEDGDMIREVKGGKNTGYKWKFLEFGTVKMKPRPFMTRALSKTEKECADIVNEEIGKIVKALGGATND